MLFSCREKLSRSFMAGMIEQHKMKLPIHVVLYFIPIITLFLFLIHYFVNYVYIYIYIYIFPPYSLIIGWIIVHL
jgi:hypothetical protein